MEEKMITYYNKILQISCFIFLFFYFQKGFSQNTFKDLNQTIDNCKLDSCLIYLNKQEHLAETTNEKFVNFLNYSSYYRKINSYDSAFMYINLAIEKLTTKDQLGIIEQRKGLIYNKKREYEKSKKHYFKALKFFNSDLQKAKVFASIAIVNKKMGYPDSALYYLNVSCNIFEANNVKSKDYATVLNSIGISFYYKAEYDTALYYLLESIKLYKVLDVQSDLARTNDVLGSLFFQQKEYQSSILYFKKSYSLNVELNQLKSQIGNLSNIGCVYKDMGEYDSAYSYFNKSIKLAITKGFSDLESVNLSNLSALEFEKGNYKLAIKQQLKSLSIDEKNQDIEGIGVGKLNLGEYYFYVDERVKAIAYLVSAKKLSWKTKHKELEMNCYLKLSLAYEGFKNDSALIYYKKYTNLNDSIRNVEVQERVNGLHIKYKTRLIKLQNKELASVVEMKNKKLELKTVEANLASQFHQKIVILLILLILVVVFISYVLYVKKKTNERNLTTKLNNIKDSIVSKNEIIKKYEFYLFEKNAPNQLLKDLSTDKDWAKFILNFELLYPDFFNSIPVKPDMSLTKNDCRVAALIQLKLSNKEIADILNITLSGVKNAKNRYFSKLSNRK